MISAIGAEVTLYEIVPDEQQIISGKLIDWADRTGVDLILTNGGTGLSQRDITPEATLAVVQKLAPGFAETMRIESMKKTPRGMLSRGVSGARGKTLIINLPGSPKAVRECLEAIIPVLEHAIEILVGQASECATDDHRH
jgi:molybdenum cofactor synthesis domain-containing protein